MRRRPIVACVALLLIFMVSRVAFTHDRGTSTTEVEIATEGRVVAHFTFAAGDLEKTSAAELLATGVELRADDEPCSGAVDRWVPIGDGVEVQVTFHCPKGATAYELTLFLLSELGPTHRNVARIASGPRTEQAILGPKVRSIRLGEAKPKRTSNPLIPAVIGSIVALFFAILLFLRYARRPA